MSALQLLSFPQALPTAGLGIAQGACNRADDILGLIRGSGGEDLGHDQDKIIDRLLAVDHAGFKPSTDLLDNAAMQAAVAIKCHTIRHPDEVNRMLNHKSLTLYV
jgi:hypothetical protein